MKNKHSKIALALLAAMFFNPAYAGAPVVLSGVAAPILSTDATNKAYVDTSTQAVAAQTLRANLIAIMANDTANTALSTANAAIAGVQQLQTTVDQNRQISSAGIAASMATQQSLPAVAPGESAMGVGFGTFDGQSAVGVAFAHGLTGTVFRNALVSAGVSVSNGLPAARAGFGFKF